MILCPSDLLNYYGLHYLCASGTPVSVITMTSFLSSRPRSQPVTEQLHESSPQDFSIHYVTALLFYALPQICFSVPFLELS